MYYDLHSYMKESVCLCVSVCACIGSGHCEKDGAYLSHIPTLGAEWFIAHWAETETEYSDIFLEAKSDHISGFTGISYQTLNQCHTSEPGMLKQESQRSSTPKMFDRNTMIIFSL